MKNQEATSSVLVRGVPKKIRDRFKAMCLLEGTTMQQRIVAFMDETSSGTVIQTLGEKQ